MPVVVQPAQPVVLTRDAVRRFMRDYPGAVPNTGVVNILLDNVEFSDEDLEEAITFTVDLWNAMTPLITFFTATQIPRVILLYGVVAHLLNSEAVRQLRNQATVQDGDVQPIGIDDKHQLYLQASQFFRTLFQDLAQKQKIAINMRGAFGGLSSGYINVSRRHNG